MKIIFEQVEDMVPFSSLKTGDFFMGTTSEGPIIFRKIPDVNAAGHHKNCVHMGIGCLSYYPISNLVTPVEAELKVLNGRNPKS